MSLGFNVKDIAGIAQLSHKLYNASTSKRESAVWCSEELRNELFTLYCALGHLSHVADNESRKLFNGGVTEQSDSKNWRSLDKLIADCAVTLKELDLAVFDSDNHMEQARDVLGPDSGDHILAKVALSIPEKSQTIANESMVRIYGDRLHSHSDAINLVLNTFHWPKPRDRRVKGLKGEKLQAMHDFQQRVFESNSELKPMVEEILSRLKSSSHPHQTFGNQYGNTNISGGYVHQGDLILNCHPADFHPELAKKAIQTQTKIPVKQKRATTKGLSSMMAGTAGPNLMNAKSSKTHDMAWHPQNPMLMSLMAISQVDKPLDDVRAHYAMSAEPPSVEKEVIQAPVDAPLRIQELNNKRQLAGLKALMDLKSELKSVPMPSFMSPTVPTIQELEQGLKYIFNTIMPRFERQRESEKQLRETGTGRWIRGLDNLLQTHHNTMSSSNRGARSIGAEHQTTYVKLLSSLNEKLEGTNAELRKVFYNASYSAGIDSVFDKLLTLTKSVRVEKEVNEFQEEREDFGWVAR